MGIYPSGDDIRAVHVGPSPIAAVYAGSQLVWSSTPPPLAVQMGATSYLPFTTGAEDLGANPQAWSVLVSDGIAGGVLSRYTVNASPPSLPVPNAGPVTLTGWVQIVGTGSSATAVLKITASNFVLQARIVPNSRNLWWDRRHGATAQQTVNVGVIPTGWVFVAAVMEPVSGTTWRFRHYINGVEKGNITWDAGTQSEPTSPTMAANVGNSIFNADDFAIYPVALTATQVSTLYQAGRST